MIWTIYLVNKSINDQIVNVKMTSYKKGYIKTTFWKHHLELKHSPFNNISKQSKMMQISTTLVFIRFYPNMKCFTCQDNYIPDHKYNDNATEVGAKEEELLQEKDRVGEENRSQ